MANGSTRAGHPASPRANNHRHHQASALDAELLEPEKRRLVQLRGDHVAVTIEGYLQIASKLPRGRR